MTDSPTLVWRSTLKQRLTIAAATFVLWSVAIEARLIYLQVFRHDALAVQAERQQSDTIDSAPKRGDILDREGRVLAYSVAAETVYADPGAIADPDEVAAALCDALGDCSAKDRQGIGERLRLDRHFVYVQRHISPEQARRVAALNLEGIGFIKQDKRRYPNRELAAHVLGYVGTDNKGLGGIEATYDSLIKGEPGTVLVQTDAHGRTFSRVEKPPTTGATLELTIDQYLQHIVERELRAGVQSAGGAGGSAVVMDPRTGEVLAMASYPTFNPNNFGDAEPRLRRNRAVQDLYDPGSTFKIVTASALLEERVVRSADIFDVSAGSIRFGSRVIRDDHRLRILSFEDVIVKSSNVGTIQAVARFGDRRAEKLMHWVRRFGFGARSSPDFPGENPGIVWDHEKLNDSALASIAIGYQISVTPLQMATAFAAVANGGELVQPRVVRAVIRDGKRAAVPRKVVRRTISPATAAELTRIMEAVVTEGTGGNARLVDYTVAGKTGTAQKIVDGAYSRFDHNVSFVGFVPSRDPAFVIAVVVDSPRAVSAYGNVVAAPIFRSIAEASLRHWGVPPSINPPSPVLVARHDEGTYEPLVPGSVTAPAIVTISGGPGEGTSRSGFPDLSGLSGRDAVRVLARLGLAATLRGDGVVIEQHPAVGATIEPGTPAILWLRRQRSVEPAAGTTRP